MGAGELRQFLMFTVYEFWKELQVLILWPNYCAEYDETCLYFIYSFFVTKWNFFFSFRFKALLTSKIIKRRLKEKKLFVI